MNTFSIKIAIYSQTAEAGPPLGTILGNLGVNSLKFCKEFNEFTKDLPNYIRLRVSLFVQSNKVVTFSCNEPTLGFLISLLRQFDDIYIIDFVLLEDVVLLAMFKFPYLPLEKSLKLLCGSIANSNLNIYVNDELYV